MSNKPHAGDGPQPRRSSRGVTRALPPAFRRAINVSDPLEMGLLYFYPGRYLPELMPTVREFGRMFRVARDVRPDVDAFRHLAALVCEAVHRGERFRRWDCVGVLRKYARELADRELPVALISDLFEIYRALILTSPDDICWRLSRLIKDRPLPLRAVRWLLDHWSESEHVTNRLLLYPRKHALVVAWAEERLRGRGLDDRRTDLLAYLLRISPPSRFRNEDPTTLAWALLRSRLPPQTQLAELKKLLPRLRPEKIVELAKRLDAPELIMHVRGPGGSKRRGRRCAEVTGLAPGALMVESVSRGVGIPVNPCS